MLKQTFTPFLNPNNFIKYTLDYVLLLTLRDKLRIDLHTTLEDRYIFYHIYRNFMYLFKYTRFDRVNFTKKAGLLIYLIKKEIVTLSVFLKISYNIDKHAIELTFSFTNFDTYNLVVNSDLINKLKVLLLLYREVLLKKFNDGEDVDERLALIRK